jgi:chromosome segregation ATPase
MKNVEIETELDALKNQKPDTSAVDALKKEVDDLKKKSLKDTKALQADKEQVTAELLAVKKKHGSELEAAQKTTQETTEKYTTLQQNVQAKEAEIKDLVEQIQTVKEDAALALKEFELHKNSTDAKMKNHDADYSDMYESMTAMVEEEQKKRTAAEKEAADIKAKFAEMEAHLKVKDAEIAEAKVRPSPTPRHGTLDSGVEGIAYTGQWT